MVIAAQQQLPGVWNRARVRRALEAAFALIPPPIEPVCDVPVVASIRVIVDDDAFRQSVVEAVHKLRAGLPLDGEGKVSLADLEATLPLATGGLVPPGELAHVGEGGCTFGGFLMSGSEAAGVTEIATRLGVAKSTVTGWATRREQNGMPEPVWQLASGAVYDLDAVVEWYEKWKGDGATIGGNDAGR
jgi:hypothetical protein